MSSSGPTSEKSEDNGPVKTSTTITITGGLAERILNGEDAILSLTTDGEIAVMFPTRAAGKAKVTRVTKADTERSVASVKSPPDVVPATERQKETIVVKAVVKQSSTPSGEPDTISGDTHQATDVKPSSSSATKKKKGLNPTEAKAQALSSRMIRLGLCHSGDNIDEVLKATDPALVSALKMKSKDFKEYALKHNLKGFESSVRNRQNRVMAEEAKATVPTAPLSTDGPLQVIEEEPSTQVSHKESQDSEKEGAEKDSEAKTSTVLEEEKAEEEQVEALREQSPPTSQQISPQAGKPPSYSEAAKTSLTREQKIRRDLAINYAGLYANGERRGDDRKTGGNGQSRIQ